MGDSVTLALKDINAAGGVNGKPVSQVGADEGTNQPSLVSQSTNTLLQDNVDAIIGAAATGDTLAVINKITGAHVVECSPSNTGAVLTNYPDHGYYFRTAPADGLQSKALGNLIVSQGHSNVELVGQATDYGKGFLNGLRTALTGAGATVAGEVTYDPNATTFTAEASKIKADHPDAVVIIGYEETASVIKSMIQAGIGPKNMPIYVADGAQSSTLWKSVDPKNPAVLEGVGGTAPSASPGNGTKSFPAAFKAAYPNVDADLLGAGLRLHSDHRAGGRRGALERAHRLRQAHERCHRGRHRLHQLLAVREPDQAGQEHQLQRRLRPARLHVSGRAVGRHVRRLEVQQQGRGDDDPTDRRRPEQHQLTGACGGLICEPPADSRRWPEPDIGEVAPVRAQLLYAEEAGVMPEAVCNHLDQDRVHPASVLDRRLRGLPGDRWPLAPPAYVHDMRQDRLLRLLAQPPRQPARARGIASDHPLRRAGRELELVLPGRGRVRGPAGGPVMSVHTRLRPDLPELPLEEWEPTKDTLHLWAQIVGKVRMASTAPRNHWWHVPLYVDVRGLTTRRMHAPDGLTFQIDFDLRRPSPGRPTSAGAVESFALADGLSVADFDRRLHETLRGLDVDVAIRELPFGVPMTTPFPDDREHASYDRDAVERFWRILDWSDEVFEEFSGWYCGKASPVHLFWHSFDLARDALRRPSRARAAGRRSGHPGGVLARGRLVRLLGRGCEHARADLLRLRRAGAGRLARAAPAAERGDLDQAGIGVARAAPVRDRARGR